MENRIAFDLVKAAEASLLSTATRRDPRQVDRLLHPDFTEIGRSGRRWTRSEIVAELAEEIAREAPVADDWAFHRLSEHLVLVTYRLTSSTGTSRHSSIWELGESTARIRFHQGTMVTAHRGP